MPLDYSPFLLSLKVSLSALLLVLPVGTVLAWWLAFGRSFPGKRILETLLFLPLVLPPTVVGYYLLLIWGRGTSFGAWVNDTLGIHLLFTWQGATLASSVMALPLYISTASSAFGAIEPELLEVGRTLGASERVLLWRVTIPLAYRGLLAGLALAFARALGEFGATLMVAGSIPGRTQTLPLALYSAVQAGQDREANLSTIGLSAMAFVLLFGVGAYQRQLAHRRGER